MAIGKHGLNVRLANRLVDWNIDVKTEEQFKQMDIYTDARKAVENLFTDETSDKDEEYEEISNVSELPGITEDILAVLRNNEIEDIQDLINMEDDEIRALEGLTTEMADTLLDIIANAVEVVEDDEDESDEESKPVSDDEGEVEEFECPECGHKITTDMTKCPNCGVDLAFEYEDEE